VIDPEILDYKIGRGVNIPQHIQSGETASVYFKVKEQFRLQDFELYTSYYPATDLTVRVKNPFDELQFDFEVLYFLNVSPIKKGDQIEIYFDKGILPYQGLRLNWRGK